MTRTMSVLTAAVVAAGGALAQPARTLTVRTDVCWRLVRHVPAPDVEYRPGVDVQGRAVAPADLDPAPPLALPERLVIALEPDLFRFGLRPDSPLSQPRTRVGEIAIDRQGNVTFDGAPLARGDTAALAEACRRQLARRR